MFLTLFFLCDLNSSLYIYQNITPRKTWCCNNCLTILRKSKSSILLTRSLGRLSVEGGVHEQVDHEVDKTNLLKKAKLASRNINKMKYLKQEYVQHELKHYKKGKKKITLIDIEGKKIKHFIFMKHQKNGKRYSICFIIPCYM